MRIDDTVCIAGSGRLGFGLTHPLDCNVYLLNTPAELALIDSGCGLQPDRIVARLRQTGIELDRTLTVLLTHGHADHAGGAAYWHKQFGARIVAPARIAAALESADESAIALDRAREAGGYPPHYTMSPVPVARRVEEGDRVEIGPLTLEVLEVPGHSADHVAYVMRHAERTVLFGGDLLLTDGRISLLNTADCDIAAYADSVRRIDRIGVDALLPGHGAFLWSGAAAAVEWATSEFDRLRVPPNGP